MASERAALFDTVKKFETELGVAPRFLERLLTEGDDWSFVIKVHALCRGRAYRFADRWGGSQGVERPLRIPHYGRSETRQIGGGRQASSAGPR